MLDKILKFFLAILCLYIVIAKTYVTIYYEYSDILDYFANFIVCCSFISLYFILFRKIKRIRYAFFIIIFLLVGILNQIMVEGFNVFNQRKDMIYPNEYLLIYDIPNILSIFVMIYLLILIIIKSGGNDPNRE